MAHQKPLTYLGGSWAKDSFNISTTVSNGMPVGNIPFGLAPPFKTELVALS